MEDLSSKTTDELCEEGAPDFDWRETIAGIIARAYFAAAAPEEEE